MITCTKCKLSKDESEFGFITAKNRYAYWCKQCYREHNNAKHADLSSGRKEYVDQRNRERRLIGRRYVYEFLLKNQCVDCSEKDPMVLEFHHLRDKRFLISAMVAGGYQPEDIQIEIDKCEILCANCHRRRTAKEQGWYGSLDTEQIKNEEVIEWKSN